MLVPEHLGAGRLAQIKTEFPGLDIVVLRIEQNRSMPARLLGAVAKRVLPYSLYQRFRSRLEGVQQTYYLDGERLVGSRPGIEAMVANWAFDAEAAARLVEALPDLRWIHSMVTGVDHFDLSRLAQRGIQLTSPRAVHANRIAEFVMALIYADAKNLFEHFEATRAHRPRFMASREMTSLTVGILGFGGIGQAVARLAVANGLAVTAFIRDKRRVSGFEGVVASDELPQFLEGIDVLVMALPLTEQTRNMIGGPELARMRRGSVLINVGRGGTLCEAGVVEALQSGQLRRACIDVVEDPVSGRPAFAPPQNHPVYRLGNVLFTSYSSSESVNSGEELFLDMMENLHFFMASEPFPAAVDLSQGY